VVKWRRDACLSSMTTLFAGARPATVLASVSSTVREEPPSLITSRAMSFTRQSEDSSLNTEAPGVQLPRTVFANPLDPSGVWCMMGDMRLLLLAGAALWGLQDAAPKKAENAVDYLFLHDRSELRGEIVEFTA